MLRRCLPFALVALLTLAMAPVASADHTCAVTLTDSDAVAWSTDSDYAGYHTAIAEAEWGSSYFEASYGYHWYDPDDAGECSLEDGDREISFPGGEPALTVYDDIGVEYHEKIYVPASDPSFIRKLHIFRNTSDVTRIVDLFAYWRVDATAADVLTTSDGDEEASAADRWATLQNTTDPANDPRIALVWDGSDTRRRDSADAVYDYADYASPEPFRDGDDEPQVNWQDIVLAPGETAIFVHAQALRADADAAAATAGELSAGPASLFAAMSDDEVRAVRNFLAPDHDRDGAANDADNCLYEQNADQLNTDGAADGGDACDADDDNDTYADDLELAIGTDPKRADTDGDRVNDNADQCPREAGAQPNGCRAEDRPPTVTFGAPAENARLRPAAANTLAASAGDDVGVARVVFVDDGRVICEDTSAPYTCAYAPEGRDVGSNTLSAVAVDTTGQTATAFRVVNLRRFNPTRVTARTTPSSDASVPFRFTTTGRVVRPARVSAAQGCRGRVSVQIKSRGNTISTRRATLTRTCAYRSRVTFRVPRRLYGRKLTVQVRFLGNSVLAAKRAPNRTVTVG